MSDVTAPAGLDEAAHLSLVRMITDHPAWRDDALAHAGLDATSLRHLTEFRSDDAAHVARLEALGITVEGGATKPPRLTRIFVQDAPGKTKLRLSVGHARDCTMVLAPGSVARGTVNLGDGGHLVVFAGGNGGAQTLHAHVRGTDCAIAFGHGATSPGLHCALEGPRHAIVFGRDCHTSDGARIQATDSQAIVSLDTGDVVNETADVVVEAHAWLGRECLLLRGARIGAGAIVAARAVVSDPVPSCTMVAGIPAKVVRERVTWSRREAWRLLGKQWRFDAQFEMTEGAPVIPEPEPAEPEPPPPEALVAAIAEALRPEFSEPPAASPAAEPAPPPGPPRPEPLAVRAHELLARREAMRDAEPARAAEIEEPPVPGSRGWWRRRRERR